jgi:hypothetical protein
LGHHLKGVGDDGDGVLHVDGGSGMLRHDGSDTSSGGDGSSADNMGTTAIGVLNSDGNGNDLVLISTGVLSGTMGVDNCSDAFTIIGGDAMTAINNELDARSSGSRVAGHHRIRIAIGLGRRRKPWGGFESLALLLESIKTEMTNRSSGEHNSESLAKGGGGLQGGVLCAGVHDGDDDCNKHFDNPR